MTNDDYQRALKGEEIAVDIAAIEKSLANLWRAESEEAEDAVTRAALWNVVAHAIDDEAKNKAAEVLALVSASVPQRTIVIRSSAAEPAGIAAWITANCHLVGGGKQVCSEQICIAAGGEKTEFVPPLVSALLLPDMPVAAWWLGDLPDDGDYISRLLDPVDRLIVDSNHFDSPADLRLLSRLATGTNTTLADLNWVRLDEWRTATASMFDRQSMIERLPSLRRVRLVSGSSAANLFGERIEALYFAGWLCSQLRLSIAGGRVGGPGGPIALDLEQSDQLEAGTLSRAELELGEGVRIVVEPQPDRSAIIATTTGGTRPMQTVTHLEERSLADLIVRQLKQALDPVYNRTLSFATQLGERLAA